jgi:hypothetical protein
MNTDHHFPTSMVQDCVYLKMRVPVAEQVAEDS